MFRKPSQLPFDYIGAATPLALFCVTLFIVTLFCVTWFSAARLRFLLAAAGGTGMGAATGAGVLTGVGFAKEGGCGVLARARGAPVPLGCDGGITLGDGAGLALGSAASTGTAALLAGENCIINDIIL
jgi:hypothetical protein